MSASETSEQIALVRVLRRSLIRFCAVPNGGWRNRVEANRLRTAGVEPGVPDLLIFDPPPCAEVCPCCKRPLVVGLGLEMKRADGVPSDVSQAQQDWLEALDVRGWATAVGYGAVGTLHKLKALGYSLKG